MPYIYDVTTGDDIHYYVDELPVRWYDEYQMPASHGGAFLPAGYYVAHDDPLVERIAYVLRHRRGDNRMTVRQIGEHLNLRVWRDAYNSIRNHGRRHHRNDSGRDDNGDLAWRAWSRRGLRSTDSRYRAFGVEIEFNGGDRDRIETDCIDQGIDAHAYWSSYSTAGVTSHGRHARPTGWLLTYDSTVTGGEIISDVLTGNDDSFEEVRRMLAIIRNNGGRCSDSSHPQGIHTNHDTRDFSVADRVRLVDNLENIAGLLTQYLPPSRRAGYWCGPVRWASERASIAAGGNGSGDHRCAFNFGNIVNGDESRVEFRQFGDSLNSAKLRCWVRVGQAIMRATKAGVTFSSTTTMVELLATLRNHGLSEAAARRWSDTVARRQGSNGFSTAAY